MARIIRADREGPGLVPGEVFDAEGKALLILSEAREKAREIYRRAERDAEAARERARTQGLEQGRAQAAASLIDAADLRDRVLREAGREIAGLAVQAAERIVGRQLSLAPETVADIVKPLLARARRARRVTLRVNPADLPALQKALPRLLADAEFQAAVAVESDPDLTRGGCLLQSDIGAFDARLECQLEALARVLLE